MVLRGRFGDARSSLWLEPCEHSGSMEVVERHTFLELRAPELGDAKSAAEDASTECSSCPSEAEVELLSEVASSRSAAPPGCFLTGTEGYTSLCLRQLPADCTGSAVAEMLVREGLQGRFDFVYAPVDFKSCRPLRYATVNFTTNQGALHAMAKLDGKVVFGDGAVLAVSWNDPLQGLDEHIWRYRNSPVMHATVPAAYKPLLFCGGAPQAFPAPTRGIRKPRLNYL